MYPKGSGVYVTTKTGTEFEKRKQQLMISTFGEKERKCHCYENFVRERAGSSQLCSYGIRFVHIHSTLTSTSGQVLNSFQPLKEQFKEFMHYEAIYILVCHSIMN
jgi:hypothetical protein